MRHLLLCIFVLYGISGSTLYAYDVDLNEAIALGLSNSQSRHISRQQLAIAEAQYQQAKSTYWPSLELTAAWQRYDENATFTLEEFSLESVSPVGTITTLVPERELTLFERDVSVYSLDLSYPLYTGGKLSAIRKQAKIGVDIAKETVRRSDNQIIFDIKKYYSAALLSMSLQKIVTRTHVALEITRDITKSFLEKGAISVDQRDYLQTEMAVATLENQINNFAANYESAILALKLVMGLNHNDTLTLKDNSLPELTLSPELDQIITQARAGNPDLQQLALSLEYADEKIKEQRSGYLPKFAFTASSKHIGSSFDKGIVNDQNKNSWVIGIKMQLPLFDGFATRARVAEAGHKKQQLHAQKIQVEQAVATQIHSHLIQLGRSQSASTIGKRAVSFAQDHTELTDAAYRHKVVETDEVVKARLYESVLRSQRAAALHDISVNLSNLELLIGSQLADY